MNATKYFFMLLTISGLAHANEAILKTFEQQAKSANPEFKTFSIPEGEKMFRAERINSKKNEKISCMTCHTANPKAEGLSRANKVIDPLAPVANQERFTDMAKVEKWFKRNCNDVLERECTITEKGNFTKYMMSIK